MVLALEIGGTNFLEALGDVCVFGQRVEKAACLLRLHIEAEILASRRVGVVMRLRECVLRLDGANERKSEQVALAGVSAVAPFETLFPNLGIGIGCDEAALPDHV